MMKVLSLFTSWYFMLVVGLALSSSGLFYLIKHPELSNSTLYQNISMTISGFRSNQSPLVATPTPTHVSKPVPLQLISELGEITKISDNRIYIKNIQGKVNYFYVSKTFDLHKLVSGTLAGGDAKTEPIKFEDLTVGQKVLLTAEANTNFARSIYVVK